MQGQQKTGAITLISLHYCGEFEEARAHLGLETQRQWSDLAIIRTTPALLGLFSIIVLFANQLQSTKTQTMMKTA